MGKAEFTVLLYMEPRSIAYSHTSVLMWSYMLVESLCLWWSVSPWLIQKEEMKQKCSRNFNLSGHSYCSFGLVVVEPPHRKDQNYWYAPGHVLTVTSSQESLSKIKSKEDNNYLSQKATAELHNAHVGALWPSPSAKESITAHNNAAEFSQIPKFLPSVMVLLIKRLYRFPFPLWWGQPRCADCIIGCCHGNR